MQGNGNLLMTPNTMFSWATFSIFYRFNFILLSFCEFFFHDIFP